MLTFRRFLIFGILFALCSCSAKQKVTTERKDVRLDLQTIISQLDSSSKIIDASNLRIELRYSSGDPHDVPSTGAVSNGGFLPEVVVTADSVHLRSTEIFRVDKLDTCAIHDNYQRNFKKDFHNNNLSYIFIIVLLLVVVITVCKKVLV